MDTGKALDQAKAAARDNKALVAALKRRRPADLDAVTEELHHAAFEKIDCLQCANCCKTTSPGMKERDVERIAKHLKKRPAEVIEQYMTLDSDGEYIFRSAPCPFLGADNYCSIYESRPAACREYPHTNRRRFHQILDLSLRNTLVCPAVANVFEGLRQKYPGA